MTGFLILTLVGVTATCAYLIGQKGFGLSDGQLRAAVTGTVDGIGIGLLFFSLNLLVGAVLILVVRRVTGMFLSIYCLEDISLPVLSLLQGLIYQRWLEPLKDSKVTD